MARLVSRLLEVDADLKKVFALQRDDHVALRNALKTAMDAGLTPDISLTMRTVQKYLEQAMARFSMGHAHSYCAAIKTAHK